MEMGNWLSPTLTRVTEKIRSRLPRCRCDQERPEFYEMTGEVRVAGIEATLAGRAIRQCPRWA